MQVSHTERGNYLPRSLESMQTDYDAYCADGSRKSRAKDISHSVIAQPMLMLPIDQVSDSMLVIYDR